MQGSLKIIANVYVILFLSFLNMQIIMHALSNPPFGNYRVWWSLSDSKYAGTALIVKKCFQPQKVFFNLDRKGLLVNNLLLLMTAIESHILKLTLCFQVANIFLT